MVIFTNIQADNFTKKSKHFLSVPFPQEVCAEQHAKWKWHNQREEREAIKRGQNKMK